MISLPFTEDFGESAARPDPTGCPPFEVAPPRPGSAGCQPGSAGC